MSQTADDPHIAGNVPVTPVQLKKFLTEAPLMYTSKLSRGAEKHILTNCYRSLWSNDLDLMQKYFFKEGLSDSDNLSQLLEKYNLFGSTKEDKAEKSQEDEPEYWESQRGKQCGHLFKNGESVYRCRNCGLDDTCVMCSKCFHATDHENHDVKIWISRGAGGCCDCGDPEAWKIPLCCKIHSPSSDIPNSSSSPNQASLEPISSIPVETMNSVKETMVVVINYILETFATSPEDVISSPTDIGTSVSAESIQQDCIDSHDALGLPVDLSTQTYACLLWNDEKHSFDAVINVVRQAIGCTVSEATHVAECVDVYGRHIIKESKNLAELIEIAKTISSIHLAVTICSTQKTVRESIAGLLLDWLKELTGGRYKFFNQVEGGNCIIRDIICDVLASDWQLSPQLASLTTRSRRSRMPEDEDDGFELEGADDMGDDSDDEVDMMFDGDVLDMEELSEDTIMDEDGLDEFFNVISESINTDSGEDEGEDEDEEEEDSAGEYVDAHETSPTGVTTAMETDQNIPDEAAEQSSQEVVNNSQSTRRRASGAHFTTPALAHHVDMLKRRRLSASSQNKLGKSQKPRDILDMDWSLDQWLEHTEQLESDERVIAQELGIPYAVANDDISATRRVNANLKKEFKRKLRIDYLLQFDLRLWKTARISIKDLLIGTFISNFDFRPVIGTRFARNYPELVDAFFFKDREPENSVSTLSVQLLTVPSVALLLVKDFKFFGIVCSILQNFFLTDSIHMMLPENKGYAGSQVDCTAKAIGRHRYAYTIFDLRYVMNAEPVRLEISKNPIYLRQFIDMIYQFQAMDPLQRQTDTHVEYESQSWVSAFNMTLQTSKLCRLLAGCFDSLQPSEITVTEASRNLCRSIYRVLKALSDWNPHLAPRRDTNTFEPDTRVIIKGLSGQKFHQVNTPNAGVFEIVDYDVSENPVSFHHPFHWLLSELFENVSLLNQGVLAELGWLGGFKQMVNDAFRTNDHDMFLMILDYPIRTLTILYQINCGVWVRNGYAVRNMSHSYRDVNVRENTMDCDIYLFQVGLTVCNSDQILLTLIDRFQLTDWFKGKPEKKSIYDASQKTYMVEEFLNLLIISATEHAYASGTSTEERIRQYIIQYLGIGSMSYSELLKFIPESLNEHESFENQLNMLANFKAPDGLSDKGLYELKPEYINEIDPYFWHYTRNQREEAHNVLKKRWNQTNPDNKLGDKEEFVVSPKANRIENGPFRHLGKFLHSHTFCQILVYALWDAKFHKESKSDTILDEALYLGMLAVTDQNSSASELAAMNVKGKYRADVILDDSDTKNFVEFAVTDEYSIQINEIEKTHATLLIVLLRCMDDSELSHAHKRLSFIIDKIEQRGSDTAKEIIADWKERKSRETKADLDNGGNGGISEYERKKAAAKARQAAIMSQFANAQSKFMEQHSDLYKTDDDEDIRESYEETAVANNDISSDSELEIVRKCHFPADTCIVCQEELDDTKLYGTLGLIQRSNIERYAEMSNKNVFADILETSNHANPWAPREDAEKPAPFIGFPTDSHRSGLDISSCGHLMHSECFDAYQKSVDNQVLNELSRMFPLSLAPKSRFLCPLCKALGNVLVPIVWKGKKEAYPGVMVPSTPYSDLSKTIKDTMDDLKKRIQTAPDEEAPFKSDDPNLVICDESQLKLIYNRLMKVIHSNANERVIYDTALNLFDSVQELHDMYAYTITDFEIAQRGSENTRARDLTVEHTGTFIDDVSSTSQLLLKILGMTNMLIPKFMDSPWQSEERCTSERLAMVALNQFMPGCLNTTEEFSLKSELAPILADDPFRVLVRMSFSVSQNPAIEIHHLLRSIYIAELTKTVIAIVHGVLNDGRILKEEKISQLLKSLNTNQRQALGTEGVQQFTHYVLGLLKVSQETIDGFFKVVCPGAFVALVRTFALPFLRKALLFMVVHHGFIPQSPTDDMVDEKSEFENILEILRLPALESIFELETFEQELVSTWCTEYVNSKLVASPKELALLSDIKVNLPTKFKLATLPYRLDQLLDESSKRVCRKCKTVPEHSAICLICGTFVCARRFCCTENNKGECNTHMKSCGGEIGIYLIIKDCFLLLLHDNGGSIMNAPYLDSHGEADILFKRGAPQYLNDKRYEQIRQMWLTQSIPAFVRRRMEAAFSATIWEAF
ncbi:hypothetical protein INT47_005372 [Mucor saturninus]|uniref:E3 ubiquitin-protein ligase n=1 Tax=Mucor saturninus TaxID=64648 RepID=A0A8H7QQX1_9FUNG|nr:hypothetical protein INT47_005372 [Mucor saturninus]